jgi:hypothetical protein
VVVFAIVLSLLFLTRPRLLHASRLFVAITRRDHSFINTHTHLRASKNVCVSSGVNTLVYTLVRSLTHSCTHRHTRTHQFSTRTIENKIINTTASVEQLRHEQRCEDVRGDGVVARRRSRCLFRRRAPHVCGGLKTQHRRGRMS